MFDLAHQLRRADILLIAAPCWDLSFPSMLKVYIENIVVKGLTFDIDGDFFKGLCDIEESYFVTTAGGDIGRQTFGMDYIVGVAEMLGWKNLKCYSVDRLDIEGVDFEERLKECMDQMDKDFEKGI